MNRILASLFAVALAGPAFADGHASGDAEAGAKGFNKCKSCHSIISDAGEAIVKGGKTGPNLFGVVGRTAGTAEGYKYGKDTIAAGEAGVVWTEDAFVEYLVDPRKYLQAALDDSKARSKMTFRLKKGGEDIFAYLASVGPDATN